MEFRFYKAELTLWPLMESLWYYEYLKPRSRDLPSERNLKRAFFLIWRTCERQNEVKYSRMTISFFCTAYKRRLFEDQSESAAWRGSTKSALSLRADSSCLLTFMLQNSRDSGTNHLYLLSFNDGHMDTYFCWANE